MWRAFAGLAFFALAGPAQDAHGTIDGVLTDVATRRPVAGALISLSPAEIAPDSYTDSNGAFRFEGLATGRYGIRAKLDGYRYSFRFVELKSDSATAHIALSMTPLAEISGRVLDEDGQPIEGAMIYTGIPQRAMTDAEGHYQITQLEPGEYRLYCRVPFAVREKMLNRNTKTGEVFGYAETHYFPGVEDPDAAVKTVVAPGVRLGGFDFRLRRTPLVEFRGRVVDLAGGEVLRGAAVELDAGTALEDESRRRRVVDGKRGFHFDLIPPGRYTLLVYRNGASDMTSVPYRLPVEIGAGGLTDAELRIPPNVDIAVKFVFPHDGVPASGVALVVLNERRTLSMNDSCRVGSACFVRDVPPGVWTFRVEAIGIREMADPPKMLCISGVRLGRQNAWSKPVTVAESGNPALEITLTDQAGAISAAITMEDGEPAESAALVAQSIDDAERPPVQRQFAGYGPFVLSGLIPGDYLVAGFTAPDNSQGSVRVSSATRCGDRAVKVTVADGQTASLNLKPCVWDSAPH